MKAHKFLLALLIALSLVLGACGGAPPTASGLYDK